jgi:hypothetical protein
MTRAAVLAAQHKQLSSCMQVLLNQLNGGRHFFHCWFMHGMAAVL